MATSRGFACVIFTILLAAPGLCQVDHGPNASRPGLSGKHQQLESAGCKACGIVVGLVEDILADKQVDAWLINFVQQRLCTHLPTQAVQECVEKAPTFVPVIIHWVEELSTAALCSDINVCGPAVLDRVAIEKAQEPGFDCIVCTNLTTIVKREAGKVQPATLVGMIEQLKKECDELGSMDAKEQCQQLVDKYGYLLVFFIEREKDQNVTKACQDLGLCPKLFKEPVIDPIPKDLVRKMTSYAANSSDSEDYCQQCKEMVGLVLNDCGDPDFQQQIASFLAKPCSWIPFITVKCQALVNQYIVEGLSYLGSAYTADKVCSTVGLCSDQEHAVDNSYNAAEKKVVEPMYIY